MKVHHNLFKSYQIQAEEPGPKMLIIACVHGDEYEPVLAAHSLIRQLPTQLQSGTVTIIPVINESAYASGKRCGEDGLDLARICPGDLEGSISQQVASELSELIYQTDYFIDMHTGGTLFELIPMAGYMLHPSRSILRKQRMMARAFNLPLTWGTECNQEGRSISVARDANVPAIYVEYGGTGCAKEKIVNAFINGCKRVMEMLGMMQPNNVVASDVNYRVEDYNLNIAHMQEKLPAPASGIFVPLVNLGEIVHNGKIWGTITEPFSGEVTNVLADQDGIAFLLRHTALVNKGQSVGGIIPITKPGRKIIYANN